MSPADASTDPHGSHVSAGPHGSHGPHRSSREHRSDGPYASPDQHDAVGHHGAPRHHDAAGQHGVPDRELAAILATITGPTGDFRHRQHVNLAFLAVRRYGMPEATGKVCTWIRQIAGYESVPQKYHHTVSQAWVELVAHHVAADPECADFDVFAGRNPALLDKRLLSRHYRSSTLAAKPARGGWVEPDLLPFPWSGRA
jgi:hypothetical protein